MTAVACASWPVPDSAVALVEPHAIASPSPADIRRDNQVVALGPTDGASYDVLELVRWLAARSKGAYFNRSTPAAIASEKAGGADTG